MIDDFGQPCLFSRRGPQVNDVLSLLQRGVRCPRPNGRRLRPISGHATSKRRADMSPQTSGRTTKCRLSTWQYASAGFHQVSISNEERRIYSVIGTRRLSAGSHGVRESRAFCLGGLHEEAGVFRTFMEWARSFSSARIISNLVGGFGIADQSLPSSPVSRCHFFTAHVSARVSLRVI